ncbi:TPR-like protein [Athelia psychrophila]|uniref:TPR-like protein n=1 Tax=Athelia psychrophila TaxID=1759441 RepID=A0A167XK81_9AGAM|nr:TPR-like protein [Fibularhizoctonia sp. CBS 109695]
MLPGDNRAQSASGDIDVPQRRQLRSQDDRENIGNQTTSTVIQTATTGCIETAYQLQKVPMANTIVKPSVNTTGASGRARVTNVAGHIFHGNVTMHMYNGASAFMSLLFDLTCLAALTLVFTGAIPSILPPQHLATSDFLIEPPPSQPLAPDIWFGRDGTVSTLAGIIAGNENPRIAIMGAGGIGKTATTLHFIRHEAVVTRYGDRIFFVACDAATSTQLLVSSILKIIGVSAGPGENLVTVMHRALKGAPPTLLLLDNFESTWEAEKAHAAIRDLLQKIADPLSSALIITMRATTPPPGIQWIFFESLPPLAASAAKEVFLAINPTFCDGGTTKKRTYMLSLDRYTNDKLESVDVSISLSMDSLDVKRNPGAIQLLRMLCLLSDSILGWQDCLEDIEPSFETATSDLFLLLDFGPELHGAITALSPEIGNIGNLIDHAVAHDPGEIIVDIAMQITRHLWRADPSTDLLKKVSSLVPSVKAEMQARYWHIPGEIMFKRDEWFLEIGDRLGAAQCSRRLGDILRMQGNYSEATRILTDARAQFIDIGDRLGDAQCSRSLGYILRMQANYCEANDMLKGALAQFIEIGDHMGAAQCSKSLGISLSDQGNCSEATRILKDARCLGDFLRRQGNVSEATVILKDAQAQFIEIGDRLGAAGSSQILGMILIDQGNFSEATTILKDARAQFIEIGHRLGEANCSAYLGTILLRQRSYTEAESLVRHARDVFAEIGMERSTACCSELLEECVRARDAEQIMATSS